MEIEEDTETIPQGAFCVVTKAFRQLGWSNVASASPAEVSKTRQEVCNLAVQQIDFHTITSRLRSLRRPCNMHQLGDRYWAAHYWKATLFSYSTWGASAKVKALQDNCPDPSWLHCDRETTRSISVVNVYGREQFDPQIDSYEIMISKAFSSVDCMHRISSGSFALSQVSCDASDDTPGGSPGPKRYFHV